MPTIKILRTCLLLAMAVTVDSAFAFKFSPIYATLTPDGKGKSAAFDVENNQNAKIAIQFSMVKRTEGLDGTEVNDSAKESFNIFPEQLIMEPGQKRVVRVTWLGKEKVDKELPFRFMAEQLEIQGLEKKKEEKGGQIKILMAYKASLYVEPPNVSPDVVVEDVKVAKGEKGTALHLIFFNRGKKHILLDDPTLDVSFKDQSNKDVSLKIEGADLAPVNGINLLAGNKREFLLPWKDAVPSGPVAVALKVKNEE